MGGRGAASARRTGVIAGVILATLGPGVPTAMAQTNWEGDVSSDWTTAGNWSGGVPIGASGVTINAASPNSPNYATGTSSVTWLSLGTAVGQSGSLSITGGALSVTGAKPGDSSYNTVIGDYGSGTLTISGGGQLNSTFGFLGYNLPATVGDPRSSGTVTISGTNSKWSTSFLDIGSSGTGLATVENGGAVTSSGQFNLGRDIGAIGKLDIRSGSTASGVAVRIGAHTAGSGAVTVDGTGSVFTASSTMTVGFAGTGTVNGTLDVTNGGKVVVTGGLSITGRGTVTLDGATSVIQAGSVSVDRANGLTITNGATIISTGSFAVTNLNGLAVSGGSSVSSASGNVSGSASLSGSSTWTITNGLTVAGAGSAGVLTIQSGSDVSSSTATLSGSGANGKITVDGAGSTLIVTNTMTAAVFTGSSATLEATNGGQITLGGLVQTQTGTFTVSGANSKLTVAGNAQFGGSGGTTTVAVSGGGAIVTGVIGNESLGSMPTPALLGAVTGSTTTATVAGMGTSWTNYGVMTVGGNGTGSLAVTGGATVYSTRMNVAGAGTGTLTISGGAQVTTRILTIASDSTTSTGNGTVTVTEVGSKLTVTQNDTPNTTFNIGQYATGRLEVLAGGLVEAKQIALAGGNANGRGSILVSGTGSELTATGITIGGFAPATLTINGGGRVEASGGVSLSSGTVGTPGTITIDNGTLIVGDYINFGKTGGSVTSLTASNGSVIESRASNMAQFVGDDASATLSGASSWTITDDLTVGDRGKGTLTLTDGADLSVGTFISVGWIAGSEGTITARGAGTTITTTSTTSGLQIGGFTLPGGRGTVFVSDGAAITLVGPATIHPDGLLQIGEGGTPGTLDATALAVNGELRLDHTGTLTVDAPLSGTGTINKFGAGTSTFTGESTFTGATYVHGGKLVIGQGGGSLGGSSVFVENGGTLGGVGTLGPTTVRSGAVHTPGNSIGTVTINGSYANAGTLEIEVDQLGSSDRIIIANNGTVDVTQATLRIVPVAGATWTVGQTYDYEVIDNDGVDIAAPFGTVQDLAFFTSTVVYNADDGNDIWLQLTRTASTFTALGTTSNQQATAGGLNSLPSGGALPSALSFLTTGGADAALDQLSGEIHAAVAGIALDQSRVLREAALSRIAGALDGSTDGRVLWGRVVGSLGNISGSANAAAVSTGTAGVIAGADGWVTQDLFLGLELGFTHTGIGAPARSSNASLTAAHLGVYGGATFDNLRARFGGSVSVQGAGTDRTPAVTGITGTLTSHYSGVTAQLFGELGYAVEMQDVTLEPFIGLTLVTSSMGSYAETGGIAALSGQSAPLGTSIATLGLRASTEFQFAGRTGKTNVALGVESGPNINPTATHSFADGSPFSVSGASGGARLKLEVGLSTPLSDSTNLDLSYRATLGTSGADTALSLTFSGRF